MKRILCYGDSNTWGQSGARTRIADDKQWPNILQQLLGEEHRVVQEGLGGRVAGDYEERLPYNGKSSFAVAYLSALPLDLVIVALGTNDLKPKYGRTARQIVADLLWYKEAIRRFSGEGRGENVQILYLCPANFIYSEGYFEAKQELRTEVIELMRVSNEPIVELDGLELTDGVHFADSAHQTVASLVKEKTKEMLA